MLWVRSCKSLVFVVYFLPLVASAQLKLAPVFSDNMVLQRNEPVHLWGRAIPGKKVQVSFGGETAVAIVSFDSSWNIYLKKQPANAQGRDIQISCDHEKIELKNILVGDIWIASGQSNMEWPMEKEMHWKEESKNANQPLIRISNPPPAGRYVYGVAFPDSLTRRLTKDSFYLWNGWHTCNSNTVKGMSAIGYYFAKAIVEKEGIPVGIINISIGGAPIETFISREALTRSGKFSAKVSGNWLQNNSLPLWIRQRGSENLRNNQQGYGDDLGLNYAYKPGFAFACGIEQLLPLPIKGVIWYQGESNSQEIESVDEYGDLLKLMISDYREKWKQPAMPFYYVQLSSIDSASYKSAFWPEFRDNQRKVMSRIAHSGMAVCSDIGFKNNVHPTNKKAVGVRLAYWALNKTYKRSLIPSGPLPLKAKYKNGEIVVSFQYGKGLTTSDNQPLRGFSTVPGIDVAAKIRNGKVIIAASAKPAYICYAWKPFTDANLVNGELLPASTFKIKVD